MGNVLFIDIQEEKICTLLFDRSGGKYAIKDVRKFPHQDKYDAIIDAVENDIDDAYVSLPLSYLNFRIIELPFSDKDRIREVLPFELDGMILGGSGTVVFDDIIVGKSDQASKVLAVYSDKQLMREILQKLDEKHIDPVCITSLELRHSVEDFRLENLLAPGVISDEERIALAMKEMKSPVINLRRNEFAFTRDIQKTKKSLRITAVLAAFFALVLFADIVVKIISTRYEIASLKNDMRKTYQQMFPGEKNIMNELLQAKAHLKELKSKEDLLVGINPLGILSMLSQIDRQGIVFHEITAEKENIVMKGEASSLSDIERLKGKLDGAFQNVTLSDSKANAQGRMVFTIMGKEKKP